MQYSILNLVLQAGVVVKIVLLILLSFSVVSWAIILFKHLYFKSAQNETSSFLKSYRKVRDSETLFSIAKKYNLSPLTNVYKSVYVDSDRNDKEEIRRAIKRYEALETEKLERYLSFLATTGSTTPFIGLFGTVWGIMNSFRGIGASGSASLAVVAPGIAEALIATAMGLIAAIPAVIAYNFFLARANRMIVEMADFSEEVFDLFMREMHETKQG